MAVFDGLRGDVWMEILGPKGMRPDGDYLVAPVPTLRLWVPENHAPVAAVAADRDFEDGLRALEEQARVHLHPPDLAWLVALVGVVRIAAMGRRTRVPAVGDRVTEEGVPELHAWASCLSVGDLEAALRKAVA